MTQQTLGGEPIDGPPCEQCDDQEATRVLKLREGESKDEMLLCDECEFPEVFGALGAGVDSERELTARDKAAYRGE